LWHEQLAPGSFNLPCLVRRFRGPLDVAALGAALADLARRHEPLRTTFAAAPGVPRQVVGPPPAAGLRVVDLAGLPADRRDGEAGRILAEATTAPFDLVDGPLFEPSLLRLGDGDHVLVVRLHHTVFDDWSVDVFRRDLSALYAARLDGAPSPLPEPAARFTTFARRQRATLDGAAGAAQRAWWRRELDGAPLAVQLPLEGAAGEGAGEPVQVDLPPEVSDGVRALVPRLRATPYMTVLAAFAVVVGRYTGQDDLVLGSVTAHRPGSAVEPLIGCFTKKVPLRLRLGGDPAFPELVARARTAVLGALAHPDVAFDAVVQDALGAAAAGHGAVPQVAVVFQGEAPRRARMALPGVVAVPFEVAAGSRRERHFSARDDEPGPAAPWGDGLYLGTFVLVSLVDHGDDGLSLVARGAFPRPAGRRLLGHLEAVLADVVAAPDRRLAELSLGAVPVPAGPVPPGDPDVVDVRGLRARRSRLEAALSRCPGVSEVALAVRHDDGSGPRLVAYVVPSGPAAPSLAALRRAQWTELPGSLWPAAAVAVAALP
ncbi:MAG: condensation domain-containing protein, partial [Acidimicrobiales bacterium]